MTALLCRVQKSIYSSVIEHVSNTCVHYRYDKVHVDKREDIVEIVLQPDVDPMGVDQVVQRSRMGSCETLRNGPMISMQSNMQNVGGEALRKITTRDFIRST